MQKTHSLNTDTLALKPGKNPKIFQKNIPIYIPDAAESISLRNPGRLINKKEKFLIASFYRPLYCPP